VLHRVAGQLAGRASVSFAEEEAVLAVARDIAESAMIVAGGPNAASSTPFANADHALLTGHPEQAVALLSQAAS
jgi:hypothetical protein